MQLISLPSSVLQLLVYCSWMNPRCCCCCYCCFRYSSHTHYYYDNFFSSLQHCSQSYSNFLHIQEQYTPELPLLPFSNSLNHNRSTIHSLPPRTSVCNFIFFILRSDVDVTLHCVGLHVIRNTAMEVYSYEHRKIRGKTMIRHIQVCLPVSINPSL